MSWLMLFTYKTVQPSFQATRAEPNFRNCGKGARPLGGHYACTMRPRGSRKNTMRPLCGHYASTMRPQRENTKKSKTVFATNRAAVGRIWTILRGSRAGPWGRILAKSGPLRGPKTARTNTKPEILENLEILYFQGRVL